MVTLTSIAVLSGLLLGITAPGNIILDSKNDDVKGFAVEFAIDGWSENSMKASNSSAIKISQKTIKNRNYIAIESGDVTVTAYSSTFDQTDDSPFIMASGKYVYDGAIAANFLSIGTKVRFPEKYGDKIFTVEDRMNKRYDYRMDIWMETRQEAQSFGLRKLKYEIVKDDSDAFHNIVAVK